MKRVLIAALVSGVALAAAACGGGGSASPGTTSSSVMTTTSSTTTTTSSTSSGPSLTLMPSSVKQGDQVSLSGSAGGCAAGDDVTLISKAFPHAQDFAGVPAVTATVQSDGSFSTTTTIPQTTQPGSYDVTARCGGGNLGLLEHLTVTG